MSDDVFIIVAQPWLLCSGLSKFLVHSLHCVVVLNMLYPLEGCSWSLLKGISVREVSIQILAFSECDFSPPNIRLL